MQEIIEYINKKYAPISVIVYGSYANGTNNKSSDFESLLLYVLGMIILLQSSLKSV